MNRGGPHNESTTSGMRESCCPLGADAGARGGERGDLGSGSVSWGEERLGLGMRAELIVPAFKRLQWPPHAHLIQRQVFLACRCWR